MCVEAAAEAVKLNCRILGVGKMVNYISKKRSFLCTELPEFCRVAEHQVPVCPVHGTAPGPVCGPQARGLPRPPRCVDSAASTGATDLARNCLSFSAVLGNVCLRVCWMN